jgi:peptide deformylase
MIVTDEDALRIKCAPIRSEEIQGVREKLEEVLRWSERNGVVGAGIAAPQIGIPLRMAIIRIDDQISIDLVNAKIIQKFNLKEFDGEGCLSFPNRFEKTNRYYEIVVENGVYPEKFVATEFAAVAIQHELDHLDGILLPDVAIK